MDSLFHFPCCKGSSVNIPTASEFRLPRAITWMINMLEDGDRMCHTPQAWRLQSYLQPPGPHRLSVLSTPICRRQKRRPTILDAEGAISWPTLGEVAADDSAIASKPRPLTFPQEMARFADKACTLPPSFPVFQSDFGSILSSFLTSKRPTLRRSPPSPGC